MPAKIESEPLCDCPAEHRAEVHVESNDGMPALMNLCTRCGRIHHLPDNAKLRERHDEDTDTERQLHQILEQDRANLIRLQEVLTERYHDLQTERDALMRRIDIFRRRYPIPPETPTATYRALMEQYEDDLRHLQDLDASEALLYETLGMLAMREDPDPDEFEHIRQLAGLPLLDASPDRNPTEPDSESEPPDSNQTPNLPEAAGTPPGATGTNQQPPDQTSIP